MPFPLFGRRKGLTLKSLIDRTPQAIRSRSVRIDVTSRRIRAATPDEGRSVVMILGTFTRDNEHVYEQEVRYLGGGLYWVSCQCANFRYVWEYALTQKGASDIIHGNGEPPDRYNPTLTTGICKHLYRIVTSEDMSKLETEWRRSSGLLRRT